ncbi:MAG: HEAT repeat domain-containing protein [Vampirovibrionales bacterium]
MTPSSSLPQSPPSTHDATPGSHWRELAVLLDSHLTHCGLVERQTCLQQLLEDTLQHQKHMLVLAESGMGKSALLQSGQSFIHNAHFSPSSFPLLQKTWVIWLDSSLALQSPQGLLKAIVKGWQQTAQHYLSEALQQANHLLTPLDLQWDSDDLIRAIHLIRLQRDMDQLGSAVDVLPKQRLANAIRSAMPFSKRVHFSAVNHSIRQLVDHLTDPWLTIAVQWVQPVITDVMDAVLYILPQPKEPLSEDLADTKPENQPETDFSDDTEPYLTPETPDAQLHNDTSFVFDEGFDRLKDTFQWVSAQWPAHSAHQVILVLDSLEGLTQLPTDKQELLQQALYRVITQLGPRWWLGCQSNTINHALGNPLSGLLRPDHPQGLISVVLPPLSLRQQRRWIAQHLAQQGLTASEEALDRLAASTQGNPFWLAVASQRLTERMQATHITQATLDWVRSLHIEQPNDWLETAWTQVLLALEPLEPPPHKNALQTVADILAFVAQHQINHDGIALTPIPWPETLCLKEIAGTEARSRQWHVAVLSALTQHGFTVLHNTTNQTTYQWASLLHQQFLQEKTQWVRANLPNDAKLAALQKIIPLSAQAGELDSERVNDILTLAAQSLNADHFYCLIQTLETALSKALQHPQHPQQLMALSGLYGLSLHQAPLTQLPQFLSCCNHANPLLREYSLRYLVALWPIHGHCTQQEVQQTLWQTLTLRLDDTQGPVRLWAYQLAVMLSQAPEATKPLSVFLKGTHDHEANESPLIRRLCIQQLAQSDAHTAEVRQRLLTLALNDEDPDIRHTACQSLQYQYHPKIMEGLLQILETDVHQRNRLLAVRLLRQFNSPIVYKTFLTAIKDYCDSLPNSTTTPEQENVTITLIRALTAWPTTETTTLLHQSLNTPNLPETLQWAIIQTLNEIGQDPKTLGLLREKLLHSTNTILKVAGLSATQAISERLSEGSTPR